MDRIRPLTRLLPYFTERRALLGFCLVGLVLGSALNLAGPWLIARAIDVDIAGGDYDGLVVTGVAYLVVVLVNAAVTWLSRIGLEEVAQNAMRTLKTHVFDHLLRHDLAFHDRHPSGRLITRVQGDTEALRVLFAEVILAVPADLVLLVGMFVIMAGAAPTVIPYVLAVLPPYLICLIWFRRKAPPKFLAVRKVNSSLTGFLTEHFRGLGVLQRFDREWWLHERANEQFADVYDKEVSAHLMPVYYFNSVFFVRNMALASVLCLGGLQVAAGELTLGGVILGVGYLRLMFHPLMRLSQHLTTLERSRAAAIRIDELLESRPTIVDRPEARAWPGLQRAIELRDVSFSYHEDTPVLTGLSLSIAAGTHVGIVGPTGSGKSTLLNLLLRFRDPTLGSIEVDGVDLRNIRVSELRARSGLVLQDIHLLEGTVLENLGGDEVSARQALDRIGLDDVSLDLAIDSGGRNFSRGERQLLTFARALVDDPELLVLDEASSALDPETESRVQSAVDLLQQGRTTITVAHRLSTVRGCDAIVVMRAGEIVETGNHTELMALGGVYSAMAKLQDLAHRDTPDAGVSS